MRESFGRVLYTQKTHEKDRERLSRAVVRGKWINILLNTITFSGVLTSIGTESQGWLFVSLALAFLSAAFALYQLSFNPADDAERHRAAAKDLLVVRNRYIHLISDIVDGSLAPNEVRRSRDELEVAATDIYAAAPDTSPRAYRKAQTALQLREDFTFADRELDRFLPHGLRQSAED